jgi:predicted P-loop ATPase
MAYQLLGANIQSPEYLAAIGRWFLISMVARIFDPGCKVDYMVVLEDAQQGTQKSTVGATLAHHEWFDDSLPELHGGDEVRISQHLRGKWLIEISELSSIGKAESELLKSFLTRRVEKYTPKFGRNEVIEPRQCVFIGTTNRDCYLRDETGNRRSWPVKTGTIDIKALGADRDQLFAEAAIAYRAGEQYWPDRDFEAKHIQPEQEKRRVSDAWEDIIRYWLDCPPIPTGGATQPPPRVTCTVQEVAEHALKLDVARLGTLDQRRITAALTRCGFGPKRNAAGRWWERA